MVCELAIDSGLGGLGRFDCCLEATFRVVGRIVISGGVPCLVCVGLGVAGLVLFGSGVGV